MRANDNGDCRLTKPVFLIGFMGSGKTSVTDYLAREHGLSAVDAETDAKIRQSLFASRRGTTVIFVSHRIQTLMRCDRILVLDRGRVAELGTHAELLAKGGIYRRIHDIQTNPEGREDGHVR